MIPQSVTVVYFSPTGTTKKIAEAIALGLHAEKTEYIDITGPTERNNIKRAIHSDILVLGFPVYEEHIPDEVRKYLRSASVKVHASVLFCVYGNVAFGKSLREAYGIMKSKQAPAISLGAFIGEHSFATNEVPIGVNRPDNVDLEQGKKLGVISALRYDKQEFIKERDVPENMLLAGRFIPRNSVKWVSIAPAVHMDLCTKCNLCIKKCPMGAIHKDFSINERECIRCYACVRVCKVEARKIRYKGNMIKNMLIRMGAKKKVSIVI